MADETERFRLWRFGLKPASPVLRFFAVVVAMSLLGAIGYLLNLLTSSGPAGSQRVTETTETIARDHRSHGIEPAREYGVPLASIPWTRNSNDPALSRIELAAQPFIHRTGRRAAVPLAYLPTIRPKHDLERPTAATVAVAEVPWGRLAPISRVKHIELAIVPRWAARRNPAHPDQAVVSAACLPWGRDTQSPLQTYVSGARIPPALKRTEPK